MIIALAGHVDHGKTSLVRALTGVETDTLQQEIQRGLTIDLGFAYAREDGHALGFVDVPGHQRFVHNMLAGVSTHQVALLVIAADDGVMPQTREHLAIMGLLGLESGIVALNKIDRVDARRLAEVEAQIRELLAGTFLATAPILPVSAANGSGVPALKAQLLALANTRRAPAAAPSDALPAQAFEARLPIDRVFSIKGSGTIVTGTLHSGQLQLEQTLFQFPAGTTTRIRGLRVNDQRADLAWPGQRCAVNLTGIEPRAISRGDWLQSAAVGGQQTCVVALQLLPDFPRKLKHWTLVHVYHGSTHRLAHLALLESSDSLAPGARALVELICDEPLLACRNDIVVIRDHGLDETLGGGRIVDAGPMVTRRRDSGRLHRLRAQLDCADPATSLRAALTPAGIDFEHWRQVWGLTVPAAAALGESADLRAFGDLSVRAEDFDQVRERTLAGFKQAIEDADQTAVASGLTTDVFRGELPARLFDAALQSLTTDGQIVLRAGRYFPPDGVNRLTAAETALRDRVSTHIEVAQPPSVGDLAKRLNMPLTTLRSQLAPLIGKGAVIVFGANRLMSPAAFIALAELAATLTQENGSFTVKQFRDRSRLGRNLVIDLLEHMDARGYTRRNDNERKVVGKLERLLKH